MDNYIPPEALIVNLLSILSRRNNESSPKPKKTRRLQLATPVHARRSVARLIREFDADPAADPIRLKVLTAAFRVLLAYDIQIIAMKKDEPEPPPAAEGEPDLARLTTEEADEFDRLWLKARGIQSLTNE